VPAPRRQRSPRQRSGGVYGPGWSSRPRDSPPRRMVEPDVGK
jgi:hypothetical protein